MNINHSNIKTIAFHSYLIALVSVRKIFRNGKIKVDPIHIFKGSLEKKLTLYVPTLWGKYADNWFKVGEICLVLADHDFNALGQVGRMPLIVVNGVEVLESFSEEPRFLDQFETLPDDNRLLIPWNDFQLWLTKEFHADSGPSTYGKSKFTPLINYLTNKIFRIINKIMPVKK